MDTTPNPNNPINPSPRNPLDREAGKLTAGTTTRHDPDRGDLAEPIRGPASAASPTTEEKAWKRREAGQPAQVTPEDAREAKRNPASVPPPGVMGPPEEAS